MFIVREPNNRRLVSISEMFYIETIGIATIIVSENNIAARKQSYAGIEIAVFFKNYFK